ncbi:MAG: YXWGXW repeat-containing protein [Myxococcota bacterium]
MRLLVVGLAGCLLVACGPRLSVTPVSTTALRAPEICGQGPYEIEIAALGARWGEGVAFHAISPHPLDLEYEVRVNDDAPAVRGNLRGFKRPQQVNSNGNTHYELRVPANEVFDNSRCVAREAEASLVEVPAGSTPAAGWPGPPAGETTTAETPGGETPAAETPGETTTAETPSAETTAAAHANLTLLPAEWDNLGYEQMQQRGLGYIEGPYKVWKVDRLDETNAPPFQEGDRIRIRFWSMVPNPLEGVIFVVSHLVNGANVSDEEYEAHLNEEHAEREREAQERAARGPSRRERRRAERRQRRQEEAAARRQYCDAHYEDEDCWGPGGHAGYLVRLEEERRRREAEAAARPVMPDGPPPPPQAEDRPPKPSPNSRWVPGYWHWFAERWVWIAGHWDVPASDLQAGTTIVAPTAPPPAPRETPPPPPAPGLVWQPGFWQWNGQNFVWIAGRWALPQDNKEWQAPSWQVRGNVRIFVPGRWRVRR